MNNRGDYLRTPTTSSLHDQQAAERTKRALVEAGVRVTKLENNTGTALDVAALEELRRFLSVDQWKPCQAAIDRWHDTMRKLTNERTRVHAVED